MLTLLPSAALALPVGAPQGKRILVVVPHPDFGIDAASNGSPYRQHPPSNFFITSSVNGVYPAAKSIICGFVCWSTFVITRLYGSIVVEKGGWSIG